MIDRLIRAAFTRPLVTGVLAVAGTALGIAALRDLPRDVFPDLSSPVFNVIVQNAAMSAEELETRWPVCPRSGACAPPRSSACAR
jgi:heavy metal efflux system protein